MKKLIKFIIYILFLPFSVLISILKSKKMKGVTKLILSLLWIGLWVALVAYSVATAPTYTEEERAATKTAAVLLTPTKTEPPEPTETAIPTNTLESTLTDIPTETSIQEVIAEPTSAPLTVSIQADTPNAYSEEIMINAGTEFEQKYFGYFLPAGDYMAQNMDTKHFSQISVLSRAIHKTEEGWEEATDANAYSFKEGETKQITIPDGDYYIKVVAPASFILTAVEP